MSAQMVKCRKSLTAVVKFQGIILRVLCVELETTGFKILRLPETVLQNSKKWEFN
jgi:hypothetical protein